MATLKFYKEGQDITDAVILDIYDSEVKRVVRNVFEERQDIFSKYSGCFSVQITNGMNLILYVGNDSGNLSIPRQLIDAELKKIK